MTRTFTLVFFLFLSVNITGSIAQRARFYQYRPQSANSLNIAGNRIFPNTIVVKLRTAGQARMSSGNLTEQVQSKFSIKEISWQQRFPGRAQKNKTGSSVDISSIYKLEYQGDADVYKVIEALKADPGVEYAEPEYFNEVLYTPNDPAVASQYYLSLMQILNAWDVEKGDTNVVVGITDTGFDLTHPDLVNSIKYNYNDPIDGLDNDNDGYVDNFRGWDIGMATKVSKGDNDPSVESGADHGVYVAGLAAATTDNGQGMAGPAFKCKFLPVKVCSLGILKNTYDGIIYAAEHGCKIINCSWGRNGGYSQAEQDLINYLVETYNVTIVAAAGNDNNESVYFPASYDNVFSVAASDANDNKGVWSSSKGTAGSNYNTFVDFCAAGVDVYTTSNGGNYFANANGTSFACPVAAGCAAIVRAHYPAYTGVQIGERLRATCDYIDNVSGNEPYKNKLGRGRINLYRAVTEITPSVRIFPLYITDGKTNILSAGDTIKLWGKVINYLDPASDVSYTVSSSSPYVSVIKGTQDVGALGTLVSKDSDTLLLKISPDAPYYENVVITFKFQGGSYVDYQNIQLTVNPDYYNLIENDIQTTITSNGRIGYSYPDQNQGIGFRYKNSPNLLYSGGVMFSAEGNKVVDNQYGATPGTNKNDFATIAPVKKILSPAFSDLQLKTIFNDDSAKVNALGLKITQDTYAWKSEGNRNFVILEYNVVNKSGVTYDSLSAGVYMDFDIDAGNNNYAVFDSSKKMIYAYAAGKSYSGIAFLGVSGTWGYCLDNPGAPGSYSIYDGFTDAEKRKAMTTNRKNAGSPSGNDVSLMLSSTTFKLVAGDSMKLAFALLAGDSVQAITAAVDAAAQHYNFPTAINNIQPEQMWKVFPNPVENVGNIKWYSSFNTTAEIEVLNITGQKIRVWRNVIVTPGENTLECELSGCAPGIYYVRLTTSKEVITGKFLKK